MDAAERSRRREIYERRSAFPVFLFGVAFLVGLIEAISRDDVASGQRLMAIGWLGFAVDFVYRWVLDDRPRTFARRNWFAILAVIVPFFKILLIGYVFLRLATGRQRLSRRVQVYAAYLTVLVVAFGAAIVLGLERNYTGSNIHTYGQAIWWACVTVTTVGFGDYAPVSAAGRMVATVMLVNGVVLISVVTATIASRFVSEPAGVTGEAQAVTTLAEIDRRLERIEAALAGVPARDPSDPLTRGDALNSASDADPTVFPARGD